MSVTELQPPEQRDLADVARWQINFSLFRGVRSPSQSIAEAEEVAQTTGLSPAEIALYIAEDLGTLLDPKLWDSIRQWRAGKKVEITPKE